MEGNLRFKTDWAKALYFEGNLPFLLCFTLYLRAISKYKPLAGAVSNRLLPLGGLYLEGRFNRGFLALRVWGLTFEAGLYFEGLILGILRYF